MGVHKSAGWTHDGKDVWVDLFYNQIAHVKVVEYGKDDGSGYLEINYSEADLVEFYTSDIPNVRAVAQRLIDNANEHGPLVALLDVVHRAASGTTG